MDWQRARSDEKKNERKKDLYEAALLLFKQKGYSNVSLSGIAEEAGFSKSNVYRYYGSREEIFLSIFADLMQQWGKSSLRLLNTLEPGTTAKTFAENWVKAFTENRQLLDLKPLLFTSLEQNSSYEQLLVFKTHAKGILNELAADIERIFPEMSSAQVWEFLKFSHMTISGLWAAASYNDAMKQVYTREQFQELKPEFEKDAIYAIEVLIVGIKAKAALDE